MRRYWPIMARETGIALALLAVYVLTLLLPLHQAAGLQRDFNALGFSTLDSWSVCQSLAQDENGEPREAAALSCPATGIAKHQLAGVLPPVLTIPVPTAADAIGYASVSLGVQPILPDHVGQSRAPPVTV
ncbi:hypothetical protein NIM87_07205 [Devosia sp. XJ19-1]|uniref:DUF2946 domain-containing protein n=1 Tax=Devosia ureilytica TaxID=2952754 RepID=A0A9Q4AMJ4_9HYPH|nr:hypothetical protein [Devosia ureilytica]MCP8883281.1 hypothetical protein [Devosia ureilytica]MCP8886351.1 hypothetical protein [Devosia ureilytica]